MFTFVAVVVLTIVVVGFVGAWGAGWVKQPKELLTPEAPKQIWEGGRTNHVGSN